MTGSVIRQSFAMKQSAISLQLSAETVTAPVQAVPYRHLHAPITHRPRPFVRRRRASRHVSQCRDVAARLPRRSAAPAARLPGPGRWPGGGIGGGDRGVGAGQGARAARRQSRRRPRADRRRRRADRRQAEPCRQSDDPRGCTLRADHPRVVRRGRALAGEVAGVQRGAADAVLERPRQAHGAGDRVDGVGRTSRPISQRYGRTSPRCRRG